MRYLVTGGAGFIGSNTVDELVRRGHSVVVLDDLSSGKEDNLAEVRNKITFIKGSITDIEVVRKAMHEAEYVLHLGARTSVPRSVKDPIETNKINIDGTLNVLVAAKELKVKRVVFAASSSAYGETPSRRGTLLTWITLSRRIYSLARHPMFLEKFSTLALGDAFP